MPDGRRDSSAGAGLDRRAHPRCVERPGPGGGHHRPAHCYRERPRPECCCARRSHRHQWIRVGHWDACRGPARQDPGPRRRLALIHVATTRARRGCGPAAARSPRLCTSAPDRPSDRALGTASGQHSGQPRSEQRARPERPAVAGRGQHVSGCLGEPRQPRDRGRDCPRNGVAGRRRASDRDVGHWGHKSRRASRGDWPTRRPARPVGAQAKDDETSTRSTARAVGSASSNSRVSRGSDRPRPRCRDCATTWGCADLVPATRLLPRRGGSSVLRRAWTRECSRTDRPSGARGRERNVGRG